MDGILYHLDPGHPLAGRRELTVDVRTPEKFRINPFGFAQGRPRKTTYAGLASIGRGKQRPYRGT